MKKSLVILIVAAMLAAGGCGGSGGADGGNASVSSGAPGGESSAAATVSKTGMPISEEPVNLKGLVSKYELVTDWNNHKGLKYYEEMSNIHIDWDCVPSNGFEERRNLLFASNDLPDFVMRAGLKPQLMSSYATAGQIIPLDDYIEQGYAPNLSALMAADDGVRKAVTFADGHVYTLPNISEADGRIASSWINQKWLDALGLSMPQTMDEFHEVLKAFKDKDPNGNGQADEIPYSGYKETSSSVKSGDEFMSRFYGAWGYGGNSGIIAPYMDVDDSGKVRYIAADEGFKEMLTYFNQLWEEGLIDKEIFSQDMNQAVAKVEGDRIGYIAKGNNNLWMGENRNDYVQPPVMKAIDGQVYWTGVDPKVRGIDSFVITSKNPNPAATLRWGDYFLSEEGTALARLGIKDETYTVNEDGQCILKEEFSNNPEGKTVDEALSDYTIFQGGGIIQRVTKKVDQSAAVLPEMIANKNIVRPFLVPDEKLMKPNFTEDESIQLSTYGTDIETYTDEQVVKFITGATPLTEWDAYVGSLKNMNLDQYLQIYQTAYDRWNNN